MKSIEIKWTADVVRSFSYLEKTINDQPILVIAWFVIAVFSDLVEVQVARFFAGLVSLVIFQALACELIIRVWSDVQDPDLSRQESMRRGGPPLLSLVFLHMAYLGVAFLAFFAVIVPSVIWAVRASLAIVLVCVEDLGAVEALKLSIRLTSERFWYCARYLVAVNLVLGLPVVLLGFGVDRGMDVLREQAFDWPILLAGRAIAALLKAVFTLIWQMIVIACLARLYANLKQTAGTEGAATQT